MFSNLIVVSAYTVNRKKALGLKSTYSGGEGPRLRET